MRRCNESGCADNHQYCEDTPPLGANPPGRFTVVRGAKPYLNVQASDGEGVMFSIDGNQLVALRNAITLALARKRHG